jgi:predicted kinase
MEAVLFIGIQAAGKSTFYRQRFADTHIRLNLDMLRTRHREAILLKACIEARQSFVVDNTNVTAADRARYIALAKPAGFTIVGYYFRSALADALQRNRRRELPKPIPDKAVAGMYKRLQLPSREEGFDALYYVTLGTMGVFHVREWTTSAGEVRMPTATR